MESKISVLVVEDNVIIAEAIRETLLNNGIETAAMISSGEEAIEYIKSHDVDLVLMDIQLAGALDGISTAAMIGKVKQLPVIYLTDFVDGKTFDRAKKTFPSNYLAKPFVERELVRAVEIAFTNAANDAGAKVKGPTSKSFFLRADTKFVKLRPDDIVYLEADRSYCNVQTLNERLLISNSMNNIHVQLGEEQFQKVHRSFVVNIAKVKEIDGNVILLEGGHRVQMGKEFRDGFFERIKIIR